MREDDGQKLRSMMVHEMPPGFCLDLQEEYGMERSSGYKADSSGCRWCRWTLIGLNVAALLLTLMLSWHSITGGAMAGCGGGSPCDQVLSSRWSLIAGSLPVSGLAVGAYLALLIAGFFTGPASDSSVRRLAWSAMLVLAASIIGSAIWFMIVQKWLIKQFCIYCMATHLIGTLIAVLVIGGAIRARLIRPLRSGILLLAGLASAGALAVVQLNHTPSAHEEELEQALPSIDYSEGPMVGSPEAPYIVTLLFDFQCSHCQKLYFMLNAVVRQYDGKLAFALRPTPLESSCNPHIPKDKGGFINSCAMARLGLAVWRADPEAFSAFESWMFTFESGSRWHPRSLESARAKAAELAGQDVLEATLTDPWIDLYLQDSIRVFGQTLQNGKGIIPKMIYDSRWVVPEPYSADELVIILQKTLGVPEP